MMKPHITALMALSLSFGAHEAAAFEPSSQPAMSNEAPCDAPPLHTVQATEPQARPHTLDREPPASLIATVYEEVDGCNVVLVLDAADGGPEGWRGVPDAQSTPAR